MKHISRVAAVICGLFALILPRIGSGQPIFPCLAIPTTSTNAAAAADFNGDGKLDLVTAGDGIGVLLNNGNGTFAPQVVYPLGTPLIAVDTADFNGDGKPDILGLSYYRDTLFVLLNDGHGSFTQTARCPVGYYLTRWFETDINGDGKLDIVTISDGVVNVLPGNGNGTFAPKAEYPAGEGSFGGAVADFNGDGKLDIVTANYYAHSISVLRNNGNGTFAPKVDYPASYEAWNVIPADFNGDGKLDLLTTGETEVSVFFNNGNGTFAPKVNCLTANYTPEGSVSAAAADFNGDGKPDIAATNGNAVAVLLNNGSGTFAAPINHAVNGPALSLFVKDINNDGKSDVIITPRGSSPWTFGVLLNTGTGSLTFAGEFGASRAYAFGDFNGDQRLDVALCVYSRSSVLWGNGDGTFPARKDSQAGVYPSLGAVLDLNGDRRLDVVIRNQGYRGGSGEWIPGYLSVLLNNGDGTFRSSRYGGDSMSVAVFDTNNDSIPDLVVYTAFGVEVYCGNGDGTFRAKIDYSRGSFPPPPPLPPTPYDFNGDGIADKVTGSSALGSVSVQYGNRDGTLGAAQDHIAGFAGISTVFVADFNGDGMPDIAALNASTLSVLLNQRKPISRVVAVRDFNHDGIPDLLTDTNGKPTYGYLKPIKAGFAVTEWGMTPQTPTSGWRVAGAGNFVRGQKTPDLVLVHPTDKRIHLWHMSGTTRMGGEYVYYTSYRDQHLRLPDTANYLGTADFDNDGCDDIAWFDQETRRVGIWSMHGASFYSGAYLSQTLPAGWQLVGMGRLSMFTSSPTLVLLSPTRELHLWKFNGFEWYNGAYITDANTGSHVVLSEWWNVAGVADMDGDGMDEIVMQDQVQGKVEVWKINSGSTLSSIVPILLP